MYRYTVKRCGTVDIEGSGIGTYRVGAGRLGATGLFRYDDLVDR